MDYSKSKMIAVLKFIGVFVFAVIIIVICFGFLGRDTKPEHGFTFSTLHANELGLDVHEVYETMLSTMDIDNLRIPVYWSRIENESGIYDFSELDYLMQRAQEENIDVTLAIGVKVPRWPECFIPSWVNVNDQVQYKQDVFEMLTSIVNRYKDHEALERWQVENEPFFPFGECPTPNTKLFKEEIELVRSLDHNHQIQSTASGEHAFWFLRASNVDVLGVSLYRKVWNESMGTFTFPYQPIIYITQNVLANMITDKVIISELQMEPWIPDSDVGVENRIEELYSLFDENDVLSNYNFAKKAGTGEIYFWGIEWWYFMKEHARPELWEAGANLINSN